MLIPKINYMEALKEAGYSSYRIQKEKIFGQKDTTTMRRGEVPSKGVLNKLCGLLNCQPGDLLEWVPDKKKDFNDSIK